MNTFTYIDENNQKHNLYFVVTSYVNDNSTAVIAYEKGTGRSCFVSIWNPQKTENKDGFWINTIQSLHFAQFLIKEGFIDVNRKSNCLTIIKDIAFFEGMLTEKAKAYICLN